MKYLSDLRLNRLTTDRKHSMKSFELQPSRAVGEIVKSNPTSKPDIDLIESAEAGMSVTYVETVAARLSKGHQDYLIERHGTLDLDPIPGMSPTDPYNWPTWKVGRPW